MGSVMGSVTTTDIAGINLACFGSIAATRNSAVSLRGYSDDNNSKTKTTTPANFRRRYASREEYEKRTRGMIESALSLSLTWRRRPRLQLGLVDRVDGAEDGGEVVGAPLLVVNVLLAGMAELVEARVLAPVTLQEEGALAEEAGVGGVPAGVLPWVHHGGGWPRKKWIGTRAGRLRHFLTFSLMKKDFLPFLSSLLDWGRLFI